MWTGIEHRQKTHKNLKKIILSEDRSRIRVTQSLMGYDVILDVTPELKDFLKTLSEVLDQCASTE